MQCTFDNLEKTVFITSRNKKASTPKVAAVRQSRASKVSSLFIIVIVALLYWSVRLDGLGGYNIEDIKIVFFLTIAVIFAGVWARHSFKSGQLRKDDKFNSMAVAAFSAVVLFAVGMPIWLLNDERFQHEAGLIDAVIVFVFQAWYLGGFTRPRKSLPTETTADDDTDTA